MRRCSVFLTVLLWACEPNIPSLELESMDPPVGADDRITDVHIHGSFFAPVAADLTHGTHQIRDSFQAWLGGTPLRGVTLEDDESLSASVPAGFPGGIYRLTVEDPMGRRAELEDAFEVVPAETFGPRVTIVDPAPGSRFAAGHLIPVHFRASAGFPGLISRVDWSAWGGASAHGFDSLDPPEPLVEGLFLVDVPREPAHRTVTVEVTAWEAGSNVSASASVSVTIDVCFSNQDCDDGLYCTGQQLCMDGGCVQGPAPDCDDHIDCTEDTCDEASDRCHHRPIHELCDDNLACTGVEACDVEVGCVEGIPHCDDWVDCTVDYCDERTGRCWSEAADLLCDDGDFCNGQETCHPQDGCQLGHAPCADGIECTVDYCNETTQSCANVPDDDVCYDVRDCYDAFCDPWQGCVQQEAAEGPLGAPRCEDGKDNDCDDLVDEDDPDCFPASCADLLIDRSISIQSEAAFQVDFCQPRLDPTRIVCVSSRNHNLLYEERFESEPSLDIQGDVRRSPEAQAPRWPGQSGLQMCGQSRVGFTPVNTSIIDRVALHIAIANESLAEGEYMEVMYSIDTHWFTVLMVGDGSFQPMRRRSILLPPHVTHQENLHIAVVVDGLGCGFVDEVSLSEVSLVQDATEILQEDFEVGFGQLLVVDPTGDHISRVPMGDGMGARVSGPGQAWVGSIMEDPLQSSSERLLLEATLSAIGLGRHGYGVFQYSLDRGVTWIDVMTLGLDRPVFPRKSGFWIGDLYEPAHELRLRLLIPESAVVPPGAGVQVDNISIQIITPDVSDHFGVFEHQGEGVYQGQVAALSPGETIIRCAYLNEDVALWTNPAAVQFY